MALYEDQTMGLDWNNLPALLHMKDDFVRLKQLS